MRPYPDFPKKFLKFTIIDILRRNKNAFWSKIYIKLREREKLVSLVVFLGSLLRAELKCRETLMVLKLEGWQRALKIARRAKESLNKAQKELKSTDYFRLAKSSYLYAKGEVYYRAGIMVKSLRILHKALKIMGNVLHSHTSTLRCLNAIGNCHNRLGDHDEAIKYYMRAYDMRQQLSGSMKHFDMPFFKGQIGTVYEGKKQFEKAIEYYKEALEFSN